MNYVKPTVSRVLLNLGAATVCLGTSYYTLDYIIKDCMKQQERKFQDVMYVNRQLMNEIATKMK